jgi:hypothetical protein
VRWTAGDACGGEISAMATTQNSNDGKQVAIDTRQMARGLLHPSTLLLLAANSLPIFGVLYWGWDVFVLLMLYWMETAIIGFWMIARITLMPAEALGTMEINGRQRAASALFLSVFFTVHAGMFMGVHMVFLWSLFSGAWSKEIHGLGDFFRKLVVGTDMWIPLLVLFLVRGLGFLFHVLKPDAIAKLESSFGLRAAAKPATPDDMGSIVGGFYSRVIVMHLTIIFSAFIAVLFGSIAPLIIMVGVKTVADVAMHLKFEFGNLKKTSQTLSAVTSR